MAATEIDVAKLISNYSSFTSLLGRPLKTIWVLDLGSEGKGRTNKANNGKPKKKWGITGDGVVRLRNASSLPAAGLSVISPNPIYILGDYNTVAPAPALVAADAVHVLSANWTDANGAKTLSSRVAANTTVNAAIITGIVPTGSGSYSGGAENAIRLLEDWTGKTLTFNGSIAVLFYSAVSDAPWGGPEVYNPPTRNWGYDAKLADLATTPPCMPSARTVFRSDWTLIKPNSKL
jgi:hypothetical protein